MSNVAAPPEMQRFIASTDSRLRGLEENAANINYELRSRAIPDKSVFVDAPEYAAATNTVGIYYPASSSVVHHNTTGLVEVTVSATIRSDNFGGAGVGFYFDQQTPTILNGAPKYGVSKRSESATETTIGASYTSVFSVRPGTFTYSLYYYISNRTTTERSAIDLATLIVRSI